MRRLTTAEAMEFLWVAFGVGADSIATGIIEATVADISKDRADADMESYLSTLQEEIDPDTISIAPDRIEGSDMDAVFIIIKTGE